jgi:hypothetical protein
MFEWLSLAGAVLVMLSCAFAWATRAFLTPDASLYVVDVSLPALFLGSPRAQIPSVAQPIMLLGMISLALAMFGRTPAADVIRRVLAGLFLFRTNELAGLLPDADPRVPGAHPDRRLPGRRGRTC